MTEQPHQPMRSEGGCSLAGPNGARIPVQEPHSYSARKGANTIFVRTCDLCGDIDWDALHEATVERVAIEVSRLRAELDRVKDARAAEADEYTRQLRALPGWCRACPPGCASCLGPDCECYEHDELTVEGQNQMIWDLQTKLSAVQDEAARLRAELDEAHRTAGAEHGRAAALEAAYRETCTARDARDTEIERLRAENTAQSVEIERLQSENIDSRQKGWEDALKAAGYTLVDSDAPPALGLDQDGNGNG